MSEYCVVPLHIQEEIMKRLPAKSLIRFRHVSKAWRSLIDSPEFIAAHCRLTQPQHLLVSYEDPIEEQNYVCYPDDDTFPHHRSVLDLPPPLSANQIVLPIVVGSSHGLLCLYGWDHTRETHLTHTALVWNPSIRKCIVVGLPATADAVGFGVCPVTHDPKIVLIAESSRCEVMVYTLSSRKWRNLSTTDLPIRGIRDSFWPVVTDGGFIYCCAGTLTHNWILSFDVTDESFQVIYLPDTLDRRHLGDLYIRKLRESLAILQSRGKTSTVVWMMEDGVQRSFTKLFTIQASVDPIVGFRKTGVPIMEVPDDDDDYDDDTRLKLVLYEPNSEYVNIHAISNPLPAYYVHPYTETLLLLGRSDCISY